MRQLILVVEDDNATRVGLAAVLTGAGYDAIVVSSMGTALQALTDERPDLLLTSMELDGCNGLQLVSMNPRSIPAIVLSEFCDSMLQREARRLGADYLVKPISPGALLDVIERKLAPDGETFSPARRWARTPLGHGWQVQVQDFPARVLEVSYGGVRIEVDRRPGPWLPLSFRLVMPTADVPVDVAVVWKRRNGETTWICGAAVSEETQEMWRELVDAALPVTLDP